MVKAEMEKAPNIGFFKRAARKLTVGTLSSTVLKSEVTDKNESINKAEKLLREGSGLIVIGNHFSLKDPPCLAREILSHKIMGSKKIVAPIAFHMDNGIIHNLLRLIGVNLMPIVTESTIRKGKNKGLKKNDGMGDYIIESIALLKKGGVTTLLPQGTRMICLGEPDPENLAVGTLMAAAKRAKLDKYAFLIIGLGIKEVDDYSEKNGMNLLDKYTVNIGACLTSEEVLAKAEKMAEIEEKISKKQSNPLKFVDKVIYEELRKVVPNNYNKPTSVNISCKNPDFSGQLLTNRPATNYDRLRDK